MERTLVLSAFAVGCLGCLVGMLGTWPHPARSRPAADGGGGLPRLTLFMCLVVPLLVYVLTLPARPPFASGQGFGRGFAIGALGALLAAWLVYRSQNQTPTNGFRSAVVASGPLFSAAACVSMPILWMHTVLTDALLGAAIGWFVNSFLVLATVRNTTARNSTTRNASAISGTALVVGVGFMVTLAVTAALGDYGGTVEFLRRDVSWRAIVAVVGAFIPLLMFCCMLPTTWLFGVFSRLPLFGAVVRLSARLAPNDEAQQMIARVWRIVPGALLMLLFAKLLATRIGDHPRLFLLTGIGLFVGAIAWWLATGIGSKANRTPRGIAMGQQNGALATVLVLSAVMAAYQIMSGVGVGLMLLAAWFSAALALHGAWSATDSAEEPAGASGLRSGDAGSMVTVALMFGSILCLYRLFEVRFTRDLHGVSLSDHYALFGFLIGALLPILLAGYLGRRLETEAAGKIAVIASTLAVGALALAVPFVMLLLFGAKCVSALYFGLAVGAAFGLIQPMDTPSPVPGAVPAPSSAFGNQLLPLLALAVALALAQWTHHVTPLALYSRPEKLRLLRYLAGALIVLLLAADYGGRLRLWLQSRRGDVAAAHSARRAGQ